MATESASQSVFDFFPRKTVAFGASSRSREQLASRWPELRSHSLLIAKEACAGVGNALSRLDAQLEMVASISIILGIFFLLLLC